MYDKMEEPSDDENDMLDLAFGLTETSRLGCQVVMSKELDGLVVRTQRWKFDSIGANLDAGVLTIDPIPGEAAVDDEKHAGKRFRGEEVGTISAQWHRCTCIPSLGL